MKQNYPPVEDAFLFRYPDSVIRMSELGLEGPDYIRFQLAGSQHLHTLLKTIAPNATTEQEERLRAYLARSLPPKRQQEMARQGLRLANSLVKNPSLSPEGVAFVYTGIDKNPNLQGLSGEARQVLQDFPKDQRGGLWLYGGSGGGKTVIGSHLALRALEEAIDEQGNTSLQSDSVIFIHFPHLANAEIIEITKQQLTNLQSRLRQHFGSHGHLPFVIIFDDLDNALSYSLIFKNRAALIQPVIDIMLLFYMSGGRMIVSSNKEPGEVLDNLNSHVRIDDGKIAALTSRQNGLFPKSHRIHIPGSGSPTGKDLRTRHK